MKAGSLSRLNHVFFYLSVLTLVISQSVMKLRESVDTTDLKVGSLSQLNHVFFCLSVFDASD